MECIDRQFFFYTNLSASVNYIVFLPSIDAKYIRLASVSKDGLIRIWCLDLGSREIAWNLQDDDNLLFWVPSDLRSNLIYGPCTRILNTQFSSKFILSENQGTR